MSRLILVLPFYRFLPRLRLCARRRDGSMALPKRKVSHSKVPKGIIQTYEMASRYDS
jgi:hypothetical protein